VLRKDRCGDVRLYLRQSSLASTWLPEGEGYLVFKSIPTGHPSLAKAHPDTKWGRGTVTDTIRQWYRYMSVSNAESAKIRADWESRFSALPTPDGDMSGLNPQMKLVWVDLPTRVSSQDGGRGRAPFISGDSMENPPVNPVTGPGRTTAEVARELTAYRTVVRAMASDAVFQADFLFIERPELPLALHRVVHGACLADAIAPDISFTTVAYEHHPQTGFSGFWGNFTPKENPNYDATARDTGGKFMRYRHITRKVPDIAPAPPLLLSCLDKMPLPHPGRRNI
jgi:hypothetical protein